MARELRCHSVVGSGMRGSSLLFLAMAVTTTSASADDACSLTPPVRANIVRCASPIVAPLVGVRGRFTVRLRATTDGRMTYRVDGSTIGHGYYDIATNACVAVAHDRPGCHWTATGPFGSWDVAADPSR